MARMTTPQQPEHNIVIKEETVDIEYEPLPTQGQGQQMATVKAELDVPSVTTQPVDEISIKEEIEVGPTEFLPLYHISNSSNVQVNKMPKTATQRSREYRERKKLSQANSSATAARLNPKTSSQRSKEYRERKKLNQADESDTARSSKAKTGSQRSREYRERKKLSQANALVNAARSNPKTASQRSKEYRERKKSNQADESVNNAQRCSDHRYRVRLDQLLHISDNNPGMCNPHTTFTIENEMPRKTIKSNISNTSQEDLIKDYNSPQGNTNTHILDMFHQTQSETFSDVTNDTEVDEVEMTPDITANEVVVPLNEVDSDNDETPIYSNFNEHCSGHIDFFNSFKNNTFGHSCAVCDRLWWQRDLRATSLIHDNILQMIVPDYVAGSTVQVCASCEAALDRRKIPTFSTYNGFSYPTIPSHLPTLDLVSRWLISPTIPFAQIRRLRHVRDECGIYGQIINVPVSTNTTVRQLPRNIDDDDYCFYVHIEKKSITKTSDVHGLVDKLKIMEWLTYLVETPLYVHHNVTIDDTFLNLDDSVTEFDIDNISEHVPVEDSLTAQHQTLVWNEDRMLRMVPGRDNTPIDEYAEELSFPTIYGGQFRMYREGVCVTTFMQAASELRRTDRRGADPQHILYIATKIMRERVKDSIAVASKHVGTISVIAKEQIQSEHFINNYIVNDLAFLRCTPKSAWYWADCEKDIFAIMRQKGAPMAFMTLCANETGWMDLLKLLYELKNNGTHISDESLTEMSCMQKAILVNDDAITCAIYFNKLVNCLLHILQAKKRSPFGRYRVLDYFKIIEFDVEEENGGSPLAQIFLWLDNVPADLLSNNSDVIQMIDQLVSVAASEASGNIHFQTHKRKCNERNFKRKKQICGLGAPFMPSRRTIALLPIKDTDDDYAEGDVKKHKDHYKLIQDNLVKVDYTDFNHFYAHNNIESDLHYNKILRAGIDRPKLFYKRTPAENWHNSFNPFVFHHLQSKMDFQIIQDEQACAAYVVKYVIKTDRGMSKLRQKIVEIIHENPEFDIAQITRKIGIDVLNSVEMSTQEAAWYLLRQPTAKSSIVPVYIPTVYPMERRRITKSMKEFNEIDEDYSDVPKENWFDIYENRPDSLSGVTLAQFVSKYYKNKKGQYAERKEPRVIRYRNYDINENCNDYRREMVLLHLPFRNEELDVLAENKFVSLYEDNKDVISQRRKKFESNLDIVKTIEICRQIYIETVDREELL